MPQLVPLLQMQLASPFQSGSYRACNSAKLHQINLKRVVEVAALLILTRQWNPVLTQMTEYHANGVVANLERFRLKGTYLFVNKNTKQI
jgi:hypothetical protein